MPTVSVTMVNTTNEELVLDPEESGRTGGVPGAPPRIAAHGTGRFRMSSGVSYLLGGDPDRPIYLQPDGAVWAPPICIVRSAADDGGLAVQVSPAPWLHDHPAA
ncbi:hypothetical protein ACFWPA_17345 [Rhodococcus sp. NPDC058505]|uniref:hypothetical protein n=1 Tax=unclassified Rhodococcus (in: high G+C Gram-positive bacteria) TaxID=192944 RepID=UPI003662CDD8